MVIQALRMPEVDRGSRIPPWKQVADELRAQIAAGRYGPDEPLPSVTRITQEYGVSRNTARKILSRLVEEGLAYVEQGMGTYVRTGHTEGT